MNPEILNKFNDNRAEFSPYKLTCETWTPCLMPRFDRHNEIEINYFPAGEITYLFHDRKITIPAQRLSLFWGLIPHQIVDYQGNAPYYVCTIPFSLFLSWNLPSRFVDAILKGHIQTEVSSEFCIHDEFMLRNWIKDFQQPSNIPLILLEMQARLMRMAQNKQNVKENLSIQKGKANLVEEMAIYIAQNYQNPLKIADIGKVVGLHPDYANNLFKKTFKCTLNEYITEERIAHAQRKLLSTDMSITQIALDSGFNSMSRFNVAFLKISGCTPREFKKSQLNTP